MLAWACRLHMSQHDCLSLSGKEFICWIKSALRDMLDQNCSCQCCSLHFLCAAMRACSCHFITASVWAHVSLALGEKLVPKLFHCVKLSAHGLPLWNSHAVMTLQTFVCNGSSSEKQAQALCKTAAASFDGAAGAHNRSSLLRVASHPCPC